MTPSAQISALPASISLVALSLLGDQIAVLTSRRQEAPLKGRLELPWAGPTSAEQVSRSVAELAKAHDLPADQVRQLGVFDGLKRDSRGPNLCIAYWLPVAADRALEHGGFQAVSQLDLSRIAFGQGHLIEAALQRLSDDLVTTTVANRLVASEFTMAELRQVYEASWGVSLDAANFHRKVTKSDDLVLSTSSLRGAGPGRPAVLYRPGRAEMLATPMARPTR